jgi:hypothetical protein
MENSITLLIGIITTIITAIVAKSISSLKISNDKEYIVTMENGKKEMIYINNENSKIENIIDENIEIEKRIGEIIKSIIENKSIISTKSNYLDYIIKNNNELIGIEIKKNFGQTLNYIKNLNNEYQYLKKILLISKEPFSVDESKIDSKYQLITLGQPENEDKIKNILIEALR